VRPRTIWWYELYIILLTSTQIQKTVYWEATNLYLIGGLEHFLFFRILGTIIPTEELIFLRGVGKPPRQSCTLQVMDLYMCRVSFGHATSRWPGTAFGTSSAFGGPKRTADVAGAKIRRGGRLGISWGDTWGILYNTCTDILDVMGIHNHQNDTDWFQGKITGHGKTMRIHNQQDELIEGRIYWKQWVFTPNIRVSCKFSLHV